MQTYTVKSGDTLSKIARDVLGDLDRWPAIAELNNLVEPFAIFPGAVLLLPETDALSPVIVTPKGRRYTPVVDVLEPGDFYMSPTTWAYLGLATLALFFFMERR